MDIYVALIIFVVMITVLVISIFTIPKNMAFMMEVIIESFMAIFVYGIAYYGFLAKNEGYPDLNVIQVFIMMILIFLFFLFVNGGIKLFELLDDEDK